MNISKYVEFILEKKHSNKKNIDYYCISLKAGEFSFPLIFISEKKYEEMSKSLVQKGGTAMLLEAVTTDMSSVISALTNSTTGLTASTMFGVVADLVPFIVMIVPVALGVYFLNFGTLQKCLKLY